MDPKNDVLTSAQQRNSPTEWLRFWSIVRQEAPEQRKFIPDLERQSIRSCLHGVEHQHDEDFLSRVFDGVPEDMSTVLNSHSIFKNTKLRTCDGIEDLQNLSQKISVQDLLEESSTKAKTVEPVKSQIQPEAEKSPWANKRRKLQSEDAGSSKKTEVEEPEECENQVLSSIKASQSSFKTASTILHEKNIKKAGQCSKEGQGAPYKAPFLTKKSPGGGRQKGKFTSPYIRETSPGAKSDEKAKTGVLSSRTLDLLAGNFVQFGFQSMFGVDANGEIPEALKLFDLTLVEAVCSEILHDGSEVHWDEIAGQETAKQLIQEMVVWPMMNPHLFKGARTPPRGLLLFGPPGTGKTLIGRAIASNIKATFFNISASSLTSKWIGEGEKMVRILFAVAEVLQPTVIFIDEIDSILSSRKSEGEHESSRRIKTELLIQLDGCNPNSTTARILLVGATNRPQELDEAARRRMPKQLYIPLPCEAARQKMVMDLLKGIKFALDAKEVSKIVKNTEGYSGADMKNLIQEACQGPIREQFKHNGADITLISEEALRPVNLKDFKAAANAQKASIGEKEIEHYVEYNEKYGARICNENEDSDDDNW